MRVPLWLFDKLSLSPRRIFGIPNQSLSSFNWFNTSHKISAPLISSNAWSFIRCPTAMPSIEDAWHTKENPGFHRGFESGNGERSLVIFLLFVVVLVFFLVVLLFIVGSKGRHAENQGEAKGHGEDLFHCLLILFQGEFQ